MPRIIQPIRPQAPDALPSILTVARSDGLDAAFATDPVMGWHSGVTFPDLDAVETSGWPAPCGHIDDVEPDVAYPETKPASQQPSWVSFYPWMLHVSLGCEVGLPAEQWDEQSLMVLEADTARAISTELWNGYWTGGHSLMRDAVDLTPGGAVSAHVAMGLIMDAVDRGGTWHVPSVLQPQFVSTGLATMVGAVPIGPGGWPISFGPGYEATGPVSSPWRVDTREAAGFAGAVHDSDAPLAGEAWIVGHGGRVEVAYRDVPMGDFLGEQSLYRNVQTNAVASMRERRAIFRFNPSRCFAALVNIE